MDNKLLSFRPLSADDVEVRVSTVSEKGVSLLLYKDARCDMRLLDETVGADRWQRRHYEYKGTLFCSVGIKFGDEWVWKDDAGSESNTESQKGEASDSFKRACFNWGIGRELYTAPFVWIKAEDVTLEQIKGKLGTRDRFRVTYMAVQDGKIVGLNIENAKTKKSVHTYGKIETTEPCCVCGKSVDHGTAAKSAKKYGKVFCSGECKERHDESAGS